MTLALECGLLTPLLEELHYGTTGRALLMNRDQCIAHSVVWQFLVIIANQ